MLASAFLALSALVVQEADPAMAGMTPGAVVERAPAEAWTAIDPDHLMIIDLEGDRRVVVQLADGFAPVHVANIQAMARSGYWLGGASVYRVQDNYVAQWGHRETDRDYPEGVTQGPPAEYVRSVEGLSVKGFGIRDPYAASVGFAGGWPVALYGDGTASLTHCYGTVGVGRGYDPDTGNGDELYAVIGQPTRHIDRNIAIVGRVIEGIEHLAALPRGTEALGMYPEGRFAAAIEGVSLASQHPEDSRPAYEYLREDSDAFARYVSVRANRNDDFYKVQAGGVDLCAVQVPVRAVD